MNCWFFYPLQNRPLICWTVPARCFESQYHYTNNTETIYSLDVLAHYSTGIEDNRYEILRSTYGQLPPPTLTYKVQDITRRTSEIALCLPCKRPTDHRYTSKQKGSHDDYFTVTTCAAWGCHQDNPRYSQCLWSQPSLPFCFCYSIPS